jgi:hypothetical protein
MNRRFFKCDDCPFLLFFRSNIVKLQLKNNIGFTISKAVFVKFGCFINL